MFEFAEIAKQFLLMVSSHMDKHTTEKGFVEINGNRITLFTPSHVQYAAYGRGAGKKPPLDPILKYVSRKGIIFEGKDEKGTAFAIQASIGKKGTKNYVPNAPNIIEESIKKELSKYSERLADAFTIEINGEIKKFNEENFKDTKFKY